MRSIAAPRGAGPLTSRPGTPEDARNVDDVEHPVDSTRIDPSLPSLPAAAKASGLPLETISVTETIGRVLAELGAVDMTRHDGSIDDGDAHGVDLRSRPDDLRYVRSLGQGGMGRVFLAEQASLNRSVAVKTSSDVMGARALLAEAVITGMLEHPNIPPIHQLGEDASGRPVLVMKRIEGAPWSEVLADPDHPVRQDNPLFAAGELEANLEILGQVCSALAFAHSRGVIHRDIKPANVMVGSFGEVMLIDWGVAYCHDRPPSDPHAIVGSPGYMAPEMARGQTPDARTDVYLLGSTLHQVLTGRPRHDERNAAAALLSAVESAPFDYPESTSKPLAQLCNRATSAAPDDRPASALEFAQALRQFRSRRTATEITDRATQSIRALEERADAEADSRDDYVAFTEAAVACRFSLAESLRAWPDNPDVAHLHDRLHRVVLTRALAADDLATARVEAAALRAANALPRALADRLARAEAAEDARLQRERELDLEAGRYSREALIGVLALAVVPLQLYRLARPWSEVEASRFHFELLWVWAFVAVPVFTCAALFHERLARSTESRRLLGMILLGLGGVGVHRVLGLALEPGLAPMLAGDLIIMATTALTGASWLGRTFVVPALVFPVGAVAVVALPAQAGAITNACTAIGALAFIWAQRRSARLRERARRPPVA